MPPASLQNRVSSEALDYSTNSKDWNDRTAKIREIRQQRSTWHKVHLASHITKPVRMTQARDRFIDCRATIPASEPVYDLLRSRAKNARWTYCKLVVSRRSQCFHSRRFLSNQARLHSITQRLDMTVKVCSSLRLPETAAPVAWLLNAMRHEALPLRLRMACAAALLPYFHERHR